MILLPVVVVIIVWGGETLFALLLAVFTFIGTDEFYRMALPQRGNISRLASVSASISIFLPLFADARFFTAFMVLQFFLFSLIFLFSIKEIADAARETAYALFAFLYIPFMLMHLVMLRKTPHGVEWLLVIMLIVMTNDSAAYYTGTLFGKRRLYPLVSPKKSLEGAAGGLLGSLCGTMVAKFTFFKLLTFPDAILTALVIGFIGQCGDLFESMLKRSFNIKDSGTLIPGHGGVLDRLDSIIFAAPFAYYYAVYIFGIFQG